MTSIDRDSFALSSMGKQAQSQRSTHCSPKISTVSRDQYEKVFISKEHVRIAMCGRESPIGGPIYDTAKSSLGGMHVGFGHGSRPNIFPKPQEDKDDVDTNMAMDLLPDSQQFKYRKDPKIAIGTEPRGRLKDGSLLKNHSVAFYARSSPGPAAIGGEFGPKVDATRPRLAYAAPFGARTNAKGNDFTSAGRGDNPPDVGPGRHERKDHSFGPQHLSHRRNQAVHAFPGAPKFPKHKTDDVISKYDAARSCFGKQMLGKNRSEPSINFSADNRDTRSKTKLCMTRQDEGPKLSMPKFVARQPALPSERTIMSSGFG